MNKRERHKLYRLSVGPGWWPILDVYVPKILERDSEAELYIKEKYGLLQIEISSAKISVEEQIALENAAEHASSTVCEFCGQPGELRTQRSYLQTLCDSCNCCNVHTLDGWNERWRVFSETERRWLEEGEEVKMMHNPKILRNRARCKRCGDIIESKHVHDFVSCKCGAICVDGGHDYIRRGGQLDCIEDLTEYKKETGV